MYIHSYIRDRPAAWQIVQKAAAAQKPVSGLGVTGVRPVDASVLTEYDFQAAKLEGAAPTTPTTNDRGLHGGEHPLQDADPG